MKTDVLYIILDHSGSSVVVRDQTTEPISLTGLLADGWRPVRETGIGSERVLILLERESDEKFGFGFHKS